MEQVIVKLFAGGFCERAVIVRQRVVLTAKPIKECAHRNLQHREHNRASFTGKAFLPVGQCASASTKGAIALQRLVRPSEENAIKLWLAFAEARGKPQLNLLGECATGCISGTPQRLPHFSRGLDRDGVAGFSAFSVLNHLSHSLALDLLQ
jgi:hypothetical protein